MDCDGSKVVLNYCVKFQIKSNNGYAAKKRRLQDINSGVGTKKKKKKNHIPLFLSLYLNHCLLILFILVTTPIENPFSTQIPHLSPIVSYPVPALTSTPLSAIIQSYSYPLENVLNDIEPPSLSNSALIPISPISGHSSSHDLGSSSEITHDYVINAL